MLAWMSRNANSSAPCSSYRRATSTGSPASRRLTKFTPLTTRPFATSRQGMMRLARPMAYCRAEFIPPRCKAWRSGRRNSALRLRRMGRPSRMNSALLALCRLERRLEIERAFVERAAGDRTGDAFALVAGELLDVLQAVDAAAGDDGNLQLAGELDGGLDVDAGQHAVAADVGVDDRFDAVILELLGQIENVVTAHLGPAVGRNLAFARVQADDDVSRERVAGVVQESGILHRRGPDDHVGNAVVEIALDGVEVADSAAKLHGDLFADHADDLADRELVLGLPRERAVEIDDVQTLCAQLKPVLRHRRRILREYGCRLHFALLQAHAMTVLDVDRGNDLHGGGRATGCR